jgi:2-polyprenyl-6-hydroxyphenyl methylase/3-demethylubiquinone-9 3-methyltransferase
MQMPGKLNFINRKYKIMKTINNDYDSLAHLWWSEDEGSTASIRYLINPVRFNYFKKILETNYQSGFKNKKALDVGCGGGFLSEELAKTGLDVTGVDPSEKTIRIAREHAISNNLNIGYKESYGEKLPFDDSTFDMVFCCDVLEHVNDINKVVSEISRVLRKGGLFFFDTINRTIISKIVTIYIMQECRFTSFVDTDGHVWDMFIKPEELKTISLNNNISLNDIKGITPEHLSPSIIMNLYKAKRKKISFKELAQRINLVESDDLDTSYMGYGIKNN